MTKKIVNGVLMDMTPEEEAKETIIRETAAAESANRKLEKIRSIRLEKLKETDWYSNEDVTMPENISVWRQSLRDIPQNYTTEEEYDLLLARDKSVSTPNKPLTHSIWSKP